MATFVSDNKEDSDRISQLFAEFDQDGSGYIDASEFGQLSYACGEALNDDEVATIIKGLDADAK